MAGKKIFVLGAGASISHSEGEFPDVESFFVKTKLNGLQQDKYQAIRDHIKNAFGVDIYARKPSPRVNMRQYLHSLSWILKTPKTSKFVTIRDNLLEFIQETLSNLESKVQSGEDSDYHFLMDMLKENDTLITSIGIPCLIISSEEDQYWRIF